MIGEQSLQPMFSPLYTTYNNVTYNNITIAQLRRLYN